MNIGDTVEIGPTEGDKGKRGIISKPYQCGEPAWWVIIDGTEKAYYQRCLKLIKNNMAINLKEKFTLALTKEPMKTFRKAGITNGDNLLTEEGVTIFLSWLLDTKYADEFKKDIVDGMLKDKEEEDKK